MKFTLYITALAMFCALSATGQAQSLNQAAFIGNSTDYEFGHNSTPNIPIAGAPSDTDWNRWAMLHDGSVYSLYFFQRGSADTLYQFGFNRRTSRYEFGHQSIPTPRIIGAPRDADTSSFAMLHDGHEFRFYAFRAGSDREFYQAAFDRSASHYRFKYRSIPKLTLRRIPGNSDTRSAAMLHDGKDFRFYFRAS